jgi:hypothetical protein
MIFLNFFKTHVKLFDKTSFYKLISLTIILSLSLASCEKLKDDLTDDDFEPNDTRSEAAAITLNTWNEAYVDEEDIDWFSFTVSHEGYDIVLIEIENLSDELELGVGLYDPQGNEIGNWGAGNGADITINFSTVAGTFYIKITSRYGSNAGDYQLKVANTNANDAYEPNDSSDEAYDLGTLPVTDLNASLVSNYEEDWYTFTTSNTNSWDRIEVLVENDSDDLELYFAVYDDDSNEICAVGGSNGEDLSSTLTTKGGTFYILIQSRYGSNIGDYSLSIQNQDINDDNEPDDTFETAREINTFPSGNIQGTIVTDAANDNGGDYEYFKVTLLNGKKVLWSVDPEANDMELHFNVYDQSMTYVGNYDGSEGQTINGSVNNAGTTDTYFYIELGGYLGNTENGNYTISFTETAAD